MLVRINSCSEGSQTMPLVSTPLLFRREPNYACSNKFSSRLRPHSCSEGSQTMPLVSNKFSPPTTPKGLPR